MAEDQAAKDKIAKNKAAQDKAAQDKAAKDKAAKDKAAKSLPDSKGKTNSGASESTQGTGPTLMAFAQGTKEELGKVVWPSRQQLISESAGVILMVSLSATLVYFVDNLLRWVAQIVFLK